MFASDTDALSQVWLVFDKCGGEFEKIEVEDSCLIFKLELTFI